MNVSNNISWKRFGSPEDGGYLLKDEISKSDICISLGIGDNYSFDLDIAKYCNQVLMLDHTIAQPQPLSSNMSFKKIGIGTVELENFTTIEKIISKLPVGSDLILKIDIEGAEWEVLESTPQSDLVRFDQIVGEFHGFIANKSGQVGLKRKVHILEKLLENFAIINVHPNNWGSYRIIKGTPVPDVIELTFINKILLNSKNFSKSTKFYSIQNSPCNPEKFEYYL